MQTNYASQSALPSQQQAELRPCRAARQSCAPPTPCFVRTARTSGARGRSVNLSVRSPAILVEVRGAFVYQISYLAVMRIFRIIGIAGGTIAMLLSASTVA